MAINKRERTLLIATISLVVVGVNYFLGSYLIGKWKREIEDTIPNATVTRFGPQGSSEEELAKPQKGTRRKKGEAKPEPNSKATLRDVIALLEKSDGDRWSKPDGAEWFVLGVEDARQRLEELISVRRGCVQLHPSRSHDGINVRAFVDPRLPDDVLDDDHELPDLDHRVCSSFR